MDDKISVIVPIYNVEKYLRQCLDSIVGQTYKNLEILLIDDGSPDNCSAICDEYAAKDARIVVKHKSNAGLSAAWNDGLSMASGDWVAFVDSDDWLDTDYFEKLLRTSGADMADIIQSGGYYWEENRGQFIRWAFLEPFTAQSKAEKNELKIIAFIRPNDSQTKGAIGYVWGKLFRASFLKAEGFGFDTKIRAGMMMDVLFDWDAFEKASAILGVAYCGYHYRVTQTSGTNKFDSNQPKSQIHVQKEFYRRINEYGNPQNLVKAMESRCLRDIVHNLQRCYFHPDNPASHREIADGIREMKQMPYYKAAIYSNNNPYNNIKLKVFQVALRLPWIWPLRVMVSAWNMMDRRERKWKMYKEPETYSKVARDLGGGGNLLG